jgi:hypothetical protein
MNWLRLNHFAVWFSLLPLHGELARLCRKWLLEHFVPVITPEERKAHMMAWRQKRGLTPYAARLSLPPNPPEWINLRLN